MNDIIHVDGGELYDNEELDNVIEEASKKKYQMSYMVHYTMNLVGMRYVTYEQGQLLYQMGESKFKQLARDARAVAKVNKKVLVNTELFEKHLDTFLIGNGGW